MKSCKILKFNERDTNNNLYSKEGITLPKDSLPIFASNFDESQPPIGEAYNLRIEGSYLVCDIKLNKAISTIAPKMRVPDSLSCDSQGNVVYDNIELLSVSAVLFHAIPELNNNVKLR